MAPKHVKKYVILFLLTTADTNPNNGSRIQGISSSQGFSTVMKEKTCQLTFGVDGFFLILKY
jgi:hypothetical protein